MTTLQTRVVAPSAVAGTLVERKAEPREPEPPRFVAPRPRRATPPPMPASQFVAAFPVAELASRTGFTEAPVTAAVLDKDAKARPSNQPSEALDAKQSNARTQVFNVGPANPASAAMDTPTVSEAVPAPAEQHGGPVASPSTIPYTMHAVVPQPLAVFAEAATTSNSPQASQGTAEASAPRTADIAAQSARALMSLGTTTASAPTPKAHPAPDFPFGPPAPPAPSAVAPTTRPNPAPTTLSAAQPVRPVPVQPNTPRRTIGSSEATPAVAAVHIVPLLVAPSPSSAAPRASEVIGTSDAKPVVDGIVTQALAPASDRLEVAASQLPRTAAKLATPRNETTGGALRDVRPSAPRDVLPSAPQVSLPLQPNVLQHAALLRSPLAPRLQDAALPDKQNPQLPFHTLGEPRVGHIPEEKQRPASRVTLLPGPSNNGSVTSTPPTPAVPVPQASAVPTGATRVSETYLSPARSRPVTSPELMDLGHLGNAKIDVSNNEARVSVDTEAGALSLHVRVRQGVADVTVDGHAAAQLGAHGRDLEAYLAKEGFTLGRFNVDDRWRDGGTVSGDTEGREPSRQGADEGDGTGHADTPTARPVSGDPARVRTSGRLHVKA